MKLNQKKEKGALSAFFSRLKSIIDPPLWLIAILAIISAISLPIILTAENNESIIAIFFYFLSAYTLTALCYKARNLKSYIEKIKSISYVSDKEKRRLLMLNASLLFNGAYIFLKTFVGLFFHIPWLVALATYYLLVFLMKMALFFGRGKNKNIATHIAFFIIAMTIPLIFIARSLVNNDLSFSYPGYLIYVFALYSFVLIPTSIKNFISDFKTTDPDLKSYRVLSLSLSTVTLLTLQSAMFTSFASAEEIEFVRRMHIIVSAFVVAIVLSLGIYLLFYSKRVQKS